MAAEHVSTAVKEEWSLTDEEVALIEASTARSAEPGLVDSAAPFTARNVDVHNATILVPTTPLGNMAGSHVASWPVQHPSAGDLTGRIEHHLNSTEVMHRIHALVVLLRRHAGFTPAANAMGERARQFVLSCLGQPHDNDYAIWDATTITEQVLSISQNRTSTHQPEQLASNAFIYGQLQVALIYNAALQRFTFGYSFVHRSEDELTTAIVNTGSTVRINSIRILYAILMTNYFRADGDSQFRTVPSNQPYPTLNA